MVAFQKNPSVLQTLAGLMSTNASVITVGTAVANQSVSGTVNVGNFPASVAAVIIGGSVAASFTPPANQSVSGTVGASLIGLSPVSVSNFPTNPSVSGTVLVGNFPTTQNVSGSVVASGTVGASIIGTVPVTQAGAFFISGSIITVGTAAANQSVSGTVGASLIGLSPVAVTNTPSISGTVLVGNFPTTQNVSGSVVASGTVGASLIGLSPVSVSNFPTTQNVSGSVVAFQGTAPWVVQSIVGTYAEDAGHTSSDKGIFGLGVRNDTVASFVSANLDYAPVGVDSAGRSLNKPFAAEEARIEGYNSVVSTSVTTLVDSAGTGLRNYITDVWVANTGGTTTLVTFKDGGGSVLGYTIAPAGGGSNLPGLQTPIRTSAATTFDIQATTSTSVLYATVKGFKGP